MAKLTTTPIGSFTQAAVTTINANMDAIEAAIENTLSRDGTIPNQMTADLDMNNNDIINADNIDANNIILNGQVLIPDNITAGTALEILDAIKTVDGAGSGLDADLLDGQHASAFVEFADTSTSGMNFVIDEDDMASDSATKIPSQQSVKAYHDNNRGLINDGTVGVPGLRFISDPDTGIYRPLSDDMRLVAGGKFGLNVANLGGAGNTTGNFGVGLAAIAGSKVLIRSEDIDAVTDSGITASVQIQRLSKFGARVSTNPKALRVLYDVADGAEGDCRPWAISGEMDWRNNSNPSTGEGGVAVSGVTNKYGGGAGVCFGAHFQAKDWTNAATTGGLIGMEVNILANGADTNSNRFGIDLIAYTNPDVVGSAARHTAGLRIRNAGSGSGKWINAIQIVDGVESITNGLNINTSPGTGGSGILDAGTKDFGIRLTGTYTAAIALPTDAKIAMESTNAITFHYDSANTRFRLQSSGVNRVSFNISGGTPSIDILTNKVVGVRKTGWTVATGTATRTSFDTATVTLPQLAERVKALIDDLHATAGHGLIGA